MKNYLELSQKYLSIHPKKTRLTILSVIISITLITGIFSMGDVFLRFEKLQVMHEYGNYHMGFVKPLKEEMEAIRTRIDVKTSGRFVIWGDGIVNGVDCLVGSIEKSIAGNMNIQILKGKYPAQNEILIENWATDALFVNASIGDTVRMILPDSTEQDFIISGIYNDTGTMKAAGVPGILISPDMISAMETKQSDMFLLEFKPKVKIMKAIDEIKTMLHLDEKRSFLNNHLLAVIGQSEHKAATGLYSIGAILFAIVLAAGVVMIYNTFNISVMERVRQFGLLRCVGASRSQIKKLVRREGIAIVLRAIPAGVVLGILMTFACSAVMKYLNTKIFGSIPLFTVSIPGICAGIVIGFLTVFIATLMPAKKASRISPVNAVTGSNDIKISVRRKQGFLTRIFRAEIAMGMNNATMRKKTLVLMSLSFALSITMFLGFQVLISFMHSSMKTTKPHTPDITIKSKTVIPDDVFVSLNKMEGIKTLYGRMTDHVEATFDASRLTDTYKSLVKNITVREDGTFTPVEKTYLISYEKNLLKWAKKELLEGDISEETLNHGNGVIAVVTHLRNNISYQTVALKPGDKVFINTPEGKREMTVMGILRADLLFEPDPELAMTTLITTEKLFTELTGKAAYTSVSLQLKNRRNEQVVDEVKKLVNNTMTFLDQRQGNDEVNQLYFTIALFVYGFVVVIALISALNIMNTMNTSITSKASYLGVLRAIGMTGRQLNTMLVVEAATYTVFGSIAGCILGVWLQKSLIMNFLTSLSVPFVFPTLQIVLIFITAILITFISVRSPIRRIRSTNIVDVVNSL